MRKDVADFVKSCDECQKAKPSVKDGVVSKMPVSGLFHTWSIDFAGPLPKSKRGNSFLAVAVEHLYNWPVAAAAFEPLSTVVVEFVKKEILMTFGNPIYILSDNGTYFTSAYVQDFAKKRSIK